jgi:hypothetical protein
VIIDQRFTGLAARRLDGLETARRQPHTDDSRECGADDDPRERHGKYRQRHERQHREDHEPAVAQDARPDAPGREGHDGHHRGFHAGEERGDRRHLAVAHVQPRQHHQDHERRQDEQQPRGQPAAHAMQQPAYVGSQLLRLGTGQQHAVVERVQEAAFGDPAPPLHQLLVHDGDLAGGPAEADEAQLQPETKGVGKANYVGHGGHSRRRSCQTLCRLVVRILRP